MMEFKITEAEAQRLAQLETEAGSTISAGSDLGSRLGDVIRLELFGLDRSKIVELLDGEFGHILSEVEIEEVAADMKGQIEARVLQKITLKKTV
jgi:hypothetical protein